MPTYIKWLVLDTKTKNADACRTFADALRCYLWYLGVPARIAFYEPKRNSDSN